MVWYHSQPLLEFARNEAYGGWTNIGLTIWALGNQNGNILNPNMPESVVKDFHAWHIYAKGYYGYETERLTFDGLVIRGDWSLMLRGYYNGVGLYWGDYVSRNFKVINSDIQGLYCGLDGGLTDSTSEIIQNTYFRNYLDLNFTPQYRTSGAQNVKPRTTILQSVRFGLLNVPGRWDLPAQSFIYMNGTSTTDFMNYVTSDQVYVYDYNGAVGVNFQVYYREQVVGYVLPQTVYDPDGSVRLMACPVAGLTNAQAWQQYGIAFAGSIAPADATTVANIIGLVKPI
jgi:hypothetical protein